MLIWLTGLPCSGKTTIGLSVVEALNFFGHGATLLDGDEIRRHLWSELGFSELDRNENVMRMGYLARMFVAQNIIPVVCAVSPYSSSRDLVRYESNQDDFIEVYVNCPLSICEQRDVKGMYAKARSGELLHFTGIDAPYEPPLNPEVECKTDQETIEECVEKIISAYSKMKERKRKEQYAD